MSKREIRKVWNDLMERCYTDNHKLSYVYKRNNVKVDKEWHDFETFYKDMKDSYRRDAYLARYDKTKNFSKNNVKWAVKYNPKRIRKDAKLVTYNGKTQTASQWAREIGLNESILINRLNRGMDVEKALTMPLQQRDKYVKINNKIQNVGQWLKENNLTKSIVKTRMQNGFSLEQALTVPVNKVNEKRGINEPKANSVMVEIDGKIQHISAWLRELETHFSTLYYRQQRGKLNRKESLLWEKWKRLSVRENK